MALPHYASAPTLGLLYITDVYVDDAQDILEFLSGELPEITDWSGTVGFGIAANNADNMDEPALAVMLCALPSAPVPRVLGRSTAGPGLRGPHRTGACRPVHADRAWWLKWPNAQPRVTCLAAHVIGPQPHRAASVGGNGNIKGHGAASGVFSGGLSGVAFGEGVALVSRVTQGCLPVAPAHTVEADGNVALQLDGEPALEVLLRDLKVSLTSSARRRAAPRWPG